jgi:hypothetical protein
MLRHVCLPLYGVNWDLMEANSECPNLLHDVSQGRPRLILDLNVVYFFTQLKLISVASLDDSSHDILNNDIQPNDAQHKTNTKRHSGKRPSMQGIVMLSVVHANCPN